MPQRRRPQVTSLVRPPPSGSGTHHDSKGKDASSTPHVPAVEVACSGAWNDDRDATIREVARDVRQSAWAAAPAALQGGRSRNHHGRRARAELPDRQRARPHRRRRPSSAVRRSGREQRHGRHASERNTSTGERIIQASASFRQHNSDEPTTPRTMPALDTSTPIGKPHDPISLRSNPHRSTPSRSSIQKRRPHN